MTEQQLHEDLGELKANMRHVMETQERQGVAIGQIQQQIAEVRGGRKALTLLIAAAGAAGAAVSWVWKHVTFG